jgi:hypothetical protein
MKTKGKFVNNNKNVVYVNVQIPKAKYHHKAKQSNNESSSVSSQRPSFSVPFTNTSNLENQILREQLNNIESDRNPKMNRLGTIINDKFRTPMDADDTFIKNGSNKEGVDVTSEADLYDAYSQNTKSFNMSDDVFERLRQPIYSSNNSFFTPNSAITNSNDSSNFSDITGDIPLPVPAPAPKPKTVKINKLNRPKPISQMNKNELKEEFRNKTGASAGNMTKKQLKDAMKAYNFRSP